MTTDPPPARFDIDARVRVMFAGSTRYGQVAAVEVVEWVPADVTWWYGIRFSGERALRWYTERHLQAAEKQHL
jgi:hypothetical protein